jgi:hypothetical protein
VRHTTSPSCVLRLRDGLRWQVVFAVAVVISIFAVTASAQKPQATLPQVYIDTTWNPPSGTTWAAHTSAQLSSALQSAAPGDTIVLDAGSTYTGNFALSAKSNPNNQWIYVVSSGLANLPVGTRVSPANAASMAKIVTPNVAADFQINGGANHWRLAGLELTSASNYGCNPNHTPPINCLSYFLVGSQAHPTPLPDSITIDRCYLHGSPSIDITTAVQATGSNYAVIDSYISGIHMTGFDTQAVASYWSPGPFKITNNYLSAAGENIMFCGAGGANNPYVPSDIQIQYNYLFKPLSWAVPGTGGTLAPNNQWVEKNAFELKSAQRVLFDSNTIENVWNAGQNGYAIVLTVRSSQSGDISVVNDVTITNNLLKNVVSGFTSLAKDDQCGNSTYPNCHNAGSQDRWYIADNLITFYDPTIPGGYRNQAIGFNPGIDRPNGGIQGVMQDVVFQHNTMIPAASTPCWTTVYFAVASGQKPPFNNLTNNIWILDNVLCRQPSGDWGLQGTSGLTQYMGDPSTPPYDLTQRFYGNVMYVPSGDKVQSFPPANYATMVPFTYVDPSSYNYQLLTPYWTNTSDGQLAGINNSNIPSKPY